MKYMNKIIAIITILCAACFAQGPVNNQLNGGVATSGSGAPSSSASLGTQYIQTDAVAGKNLWAVTFNNGAGQLLWTNLATGQQQAVGGVITNGLKIAIDGTTGCTASTSISDISGNGNTGLFGTKVLAENTGLSGNGSQTTFSGTLANHPIIAGAFDLQVATGAGNAFPYDDGAGNITGSGASAGSGTINYNTGAWSYTFASAPTNASTIFANYAKSGGGPTCAPTGLTFSSNSTVTFPNIGDISSAATLCGVFNIGTNSSTNPIWGWNENGGSGNTAILAAQWNVDHTPYFAWGNAHFTASGANNQSNDGNWHYWCLVGASGIVNTYLDGSMVGLVNTAFTPQSTVGNVQLGFLVVNGAFNTLTGTIGPSEIYNRALTQAEIRYNLQLHRQQMAALGVTNFSPTTVDAIIFDGDSLSTDFSALTWESSQPYQTTQLLGNNLYYLNVAIGGQTCVQRLAAAPSQVDPLILASRKNYVIAEMGTNDVCTVASPNITNIYNCLVSYAQGRRSLGAKVLMSTVLPRTGCTDASFETDRQSLNTKIRANVGGVFDGVIDIGNDPVVGQSGNQSNTTYYQADATHGKQPLYSIWANDFANQLKILFGIQSANNTLIAADIALGAGWGTTASVGTVSGTEQSGQFIVTSAGTGQASNTSTITVSFANPKIFQQAPSCTVQQTGGTVLNTTSTWTTSATALTITYGTLPVATDTYNFSYQCK